MSLHVVLIRDSECPNVEAARSNLRSAFEAIGQTPRWREFDRNSEGTPAEWRAFGSPTILVNGRDVAGSEPIAGGNSCRVYRSPEGWLVGIPGVEQITAALKAASSLGWMSSVAVLPALVALLPNVACPACWPAYTALLSSLGVGFLPTGRYLPTVTLLGLAIPLGVLALKARRGRGLMPFVFGLVGATALVVGRFALASAALVFVGVAMLAGASLWDTWAKRRKATACPACSLVQISTHQIGE